jgi:hypothetical protein
MGSIWRFRLAAVTNARHRHQSAEPEISFIAREGYCRPVNCITGATRGLSYKRQGRPLVGSFGGRKWPLPRAVSRAFLLAATENEGCHVSVARPPAQCDRHRRLPRRCDLSQAGQERRRAIGLNRARLYRHTEEDKRSPFALQVGRAGHKYKLWPRNHYSQWLLVE